MGRGRKPSTGGVERGNGYAPPMPSTLSKAAQGKWHAIVPLVAKLVSLQEADADALQQYCEAEVRRAKAIAQLEEEPLLESGPNGARYANPLMKVISQCETTMLKLAERFGLDPSSRKRLQIEAAKAASAFGDFLKGKERAKPECVDT